MNNPEKLVPIEMGNYEMMFEKADPKDDQGWKYKGTPVEYNPEDHKRNTLGLGILQSFSYRGKYYRCRLCIRTNCSLCLYNDSWY